MLLELLFVVATVTRTDFTPGCLCTPFDADFDGYRYNERIPHCGRNVSKHTEKLVAGFYDIDLKDRKKYEFDHLIPLSLGGSNNACNIWPQPIFEAREKDKLELKLYYMMKKGLISQKSAILYLFSWRYSK